MRQARRPTDPASSDVVRPLAAALRRALPGIARDGVAALMVGLALWIASLEMAEILAETRMRAEGQEPRRAAASNQLFCERWGIAPGTPEFKLCTEDLHRIRRSMDWRRQQFVPF